MSLVEDYTEAVEKIFKETHGLSEKAEKSQNLMK